MMLTAKQETFALCLFRGMSNREAWKQAGYSMRGQENTIDAHASRLTINDKVAARLKELRQQVADPTIATVVERKQRLTKIVRVDLKPEEVTPRDVIAATQELNKLGGDYPNEKKVADALSDIVFVIGKGYKDSNSDITQA
jgi:phage terminase small subunit